MRIFELFFERRPLTHPPEKQIALVQRRERSESARAERDEGKAGRPRQVDADLHGAKRIRHDYKEHPRVSEYLRIDCRQVSVRTHSQIGFPSPIGEMYCRKPIKTPVH